MSWRARRSVGVPLGILFIALVVMIDVWFVRRLIYTDVAGQQITFLTFAMAVAVLATVPLVVLLVYHTLGCMTLRYRLDRNGVTIQWFGNRLLIPIRDVQRILHGEQMGDAVVGRRGMRWPGHERGEGALPGIGRTRFLATRPLAQQILLVAPGTAVSISPSNPEEFLEAFAARHALGPSRILEAEAHRARWLTWPLWGDRTAWVLLGAAVAINLGLFAFLAARFPGLDPQLPLHFSSAGTADRIEPKGALFTLPIIGLIILGTNLLLGLALYKWERAGSYLLWGAAAAAQALFCLATFSILS